MSTSNSLLNERRKELERRLAQLSPEKRALLDQPVERTSAPVDTDGIQPRQSGVPVPMSFAQELLWLLDRANPGMHAYNVPRTLRLRGVLHVSALQHALEALVERHEVLRSTFVAVDGEPRQIVHAPAGVPIAEIDLRALPATNREGEALRVIQELTRRPFDLANDLQLRATVVRLEDDDQVLLLESHHVASDGWSRNILMRELTTLYAAYRNETTPDLAPLPIQYGDYALWQRNTLQGARLDQLLAYWRDTLAGASQALDLPTDRPRPAAPSFEGALTTVVFPLAFVEKLRRLSEVHGCTLFMTLLAGFDVLLARYSRQQDVVVGSPIAGRSHAETQGLIGYFSDTLPLRTSLDGDPTFIELLGRVRETCLGAYEHQDVPYEKLVLELQRESALSRDPLMRVMFTLQDAQFRAAQLEGLSLLPFGSDRGATKFDLFLFAHERPDGLRMALEYRTDLFDATTIDRFLDSLRVVLESVADHPSQHVSHIPLVSEEERETLLTIGNATTTPYPDTTTLHEIIQAQVKRTPDAIAVEGEDAAGNLVQWSYATLDARAEAVAQRLRTSGITAGSGVAICIDRTPDMLAGLLGILKAGGYYVPLDPEFPAQRLAFMVEDSAVPVLLTTRALQPIVPMPQNRPAPVVLLLDADNPSHAAATTAVTATPVSATDAAYVIYTSGSTGLPKGVAISHQSIVNFLTSMAHTPGCSAHDTLLAVTTLSFDIAGLELWLPLTVGARVVIASRETVVDGERLAERLNTSGATMLQATPATWRLLVAAGWRAACAGDARWPKMKMLCGGEALPPDLANELLGRTGSDGSLWNMYGPTETTVWSAVSRVEAAMPITLGAPIANTQLYILEPSGEPAPLGVPGELYIGGAGVALEYVRRPELTAERFVTPALGTRPAARLYRTGDLVRRRANGVIEFFGRIDTQVKLRGYRIELGEIESTLAQHTDVRQTAVVVHHDGAGEPRLVAYIVPQAEDDASAAVERWQSVWDETYSEGTLHAGEPMEAVDPSFNISGWNSSYDMRPIPANEMREWVDCTCDRILGLRPRRVLEIGCGTGLLLFRIAPHCQEYVGVDFSPSALQGIAANPAMQQLPGVSLRQGYADRIDELQLGAFDTIIINSVIQYFPDVEYLVRVIEQLVPLLVPGGSLFIGDVRSLPLLETFHASIALHQAPAELPVADVAARVQQRLAKETELVIDPTFFKAVQLHLPAIGGCAILAKRGRTRNEMTKYRYDVVLRAGSRVEVQDPAQVTTAQAESVADVRALLAARPPVLNVPNLTDRRLSHDRAAQALISARKGTVQELRDTLTTLPETGLEPEDIVSLDAAYRTEFVVSDTDLGGHFDVIFRSASVSDAPVSSGARVAMKPWREFVHQPSTDTFAIAQVAAWREHLATRLPEYMVPSVFVRLDRLPLTPNGKIDRKALPAPDAGNIVATTPFVEPRTPTESALAEIWKDVLQRPRVGVNDDFFDLGGHSLTALRVISRVTERFRVRLALRTLFEAPTIAQFALRVEEGIAAQGETGPSRALIPRRDSDEAPLSHRQELIWLLQRTSPNAAYNMPEQWRLRGALNSEALQHALDMLVERHEALRTRFVARDGLPVQVIDPARGMSLERVDVSHLPERHREAEAARVVTERARAPFDLGAEHAVRSTLVRVADDDHLFSLVLHHIVSDGWSRGVILRELSALYESLCTDAPLSLSPLPIRYADFAAWQRDALQGTTLEQHVEYWTKTLGDSSLTIDLPTDHPRPTVPAFAGAKRTIVLSRELLDGLRKLAQRNDATLFMVLLAAFDTVLHRYSGQDDIAVATVVAGRERPELEGVVGYFANTIALQTSFRGDPTFLDVVSRVREAQLGASEHADVPFEMLAMDRGQGSTSHAPALSQVMFVVQNNDPAGLQLNGVDAQAAGVELGTAKFDLSLSMGEDPRGLRAALQYRTDLFDPETADRILGHLTTVLNAVVRDPGARVSMLPILTDVERAQLNAWNETTTVYPRESTIHALFSDQAARTPDAVAAALGTRTLTYAELDRASDRIAGYLRTNGVPAGALVGVCMERSFEALAALLAVLKAGAGYVPLDPDYPADRLAFMLSDTQASIVLAQRQLSSALIAAFESGGMSVLPRVVYLDQDATITESSGDAGRTPDPVANVGTPLGSATSVAYVMYTSGSTGKPKGVAVPHRAVVRLVRETNYVHLGPSDVILGFAPISFDASTFELWGALLNGGRVALCPPGRLGPADLGAVVEQHGVTTAWFTAALFNQVVDDGLQRFGSVRQLLAGGEVLSVPHVRKALELLPGCRIINGYGPTENTTFTTCYSIPASWPADRPLPIGRPIANTTAYALDNHGQMVPVGVAGELYTGGDGLALEYLHRPELTAERFVMQSPRGTRERLYRTGDVVRWNAHGVLEYLGRNDSQVKIRGFRIEPGEIEAVLTEHPAVREAAVLVREPAPGDKQLVAYIAGDPACSVETLRSYLRERLPAYMVPAAFVVLPALPLTASGKLDRLSLPAPDELPGAAAERVAPRTPTEERLAAIWSDILRRSPIGVTETLFDLGGHSLAAMRIVSRVQEVFSMHVSLQTIFEHPTVAQMAAFLDTQSPAVSANRPSAGISRVSRTAHRRPRAEGGAQ